MSLDFSSTVLAYAPWSISKVDVAKQCGLRFTWQYIEKKKMVGGEERAEGRIGKAAHKAIELVLRGGDIQEAFKVAAVDSRLTTNEVDTLLTFKGTIGQFLERIKVFKEKHETDQQVVEHKFGLTVDLTPSTFFGKDVFFRGVWDLGLLLRRRDLIIVDHKSGKPADTLDRYTNQLNTYAIAGKVLFPDIRGVQSALHYMADGSVKWATYVTANEITDSLIKWFVTYLNQSVADLNKTATPGWYCGYCSYSSICDAYQATKK